MTIHLEPLPLNADKSLPIFASEDCQTLLQAWDDFYPVIGFQPPWIGYIAVCDGQIIGSGALIHSSEDRTAEVSYWTFKAWEGQGVGSEICRQLVAIARAADPTLRIIAKTAPEENASTSILKRNGFAYSGVVQDHEIGDAWLWTLRP